jgi:hypothetical protein
MSEKLIQEILLKMNYNPSMTLKENLELLEQKPDNLMPFQPDNPAYKTKQGGLDTKQYLKDIKTVGDIITDPHFFLPVAAVGVSLLTGGIGGLVLGGIIELSDAALYYKEGRPEEFGIALIFALIPGISKLLPKKFTSEVVKSFLNKLKIGGPLNKLEKELASWIETNKSYLIKESLKVANKSLFKKLISKYSLRQSIGLMLHLIKLGVISTKYSVTVPAAIGGGAVVLFTIVELASKLGVSIMGLDTRNVKLSSQQEKVPLKNIMEDTNRIKTQFVKEVEKEIPKIDSTQLHKEVAESLPKFHSNIDSIIQYHRKSVQTFSDTSKANQ